MKWLQGILARVEAFPDGEIKKYQPTDGVKDREKIIGEVSEGLRKLFAYHSALIERYNALSEAHEWAHHKPDFNPGSCEGHEALISSLSDEIEILKKAFWRELKDELKITAGGIAIRKGWKVVEKQKEESHVIEVIGVGMGPGSFLGYLLGRR